MPQLFQVLKCYKCMVFQVHQTKKSNKWECKLCDEKQSIKRHYGLGTGKECREHVQKLNGIRGKIDELNESIELNKSSEEENENDTLNIDTRQTISEKLNTSNESKWSNFIDETEPPTPETNESMYLGNTEVVLEVPVRKRKKFKPPTSTVESLPATLNESENKDVPNTSIYKHRKISKPNPAKSNHSTFFKTNSCNVQATTSSPEAPIIKDSLPHSEAYKNNITDEKVTEKSNIQNENYIKSKIYVPPKINNNSKWAEFTDELDENESNSKENSLFENVFADPLANNNQNTYLENLDHEKQREFTQSKSNSSENITKHLFALCDESELDDILEF